MIEIYEPLLSIALCSYNGDEFISEQVHSILKQTYKNFELIISDDCSTDKTLAILENFAQKDKRIILLKNNTNQGYIRNFEKAISHCKGEIIFLSDQDDVWDENKLSKVSQTYKNDVELVFHDSLFINQNGESLNRKASDRFTLSEQVTPLSFLLFNGISGHALAFKKSLKSFILPLPEIVHHDCWISYVAACKGKIVYEPSILVNYRQHHKSETDLLKLKVKEKTKSNSILKNQNLINRTKKLSEIEYNNHLFEFEKFKSLLEKRKKQYFSFKLFYFIIKYNQKIFSFKRKKGSLRLLYAIPYLFGLKIKD
ncbi:hypothetical protein A5893_05795 [Pedobacter psychrophilus]|uniref:Glycosyltransferase 2-like domain-containing protein n=1 Tax=Pedobacter psychrophilus TaxID=1826909 RepID=A0A179DIB3_9SPHI|nr:glycosyltransferase family 2 protein [Pedobacter psychrophilus]OAQ40460.1 hypothetical protein A5893_05795 [Pedobacter psychrophilus]